MRVLKYLCIVICVIIAFSLSACEEQGLPSAGELDNGGVVSTDFDPNAHKPKPEPEKLYLNFLTNLNNLKESELDRMPVAVVLKNSADAKTVHSGLEAADIVFEAAIENGETVLLAVYKVAPSGVNIGPLSSGVKIFADIALSFNWKLAAYGIDTEHAEVFLTDYGVQYLNLSDEKFKISVDNGKGDDLKAYTDGDKLNTAISENGLTVDINTPPIWMFTDNRAAMPDSAKKVTVKFSDTATTEFCYDEDKTAYTRDTNQNDSYSNLFVLKTTVGKYDGCEHLNYQLMAGEGYYATAGGYEKITWRRDSSAGSIYFLDANGMLLNINKGRSYICFVNSSIEDSFKVE